jgi:ubiquinone/menaquinone biosynthesis C-methylase UbiE/DNA-binding XRE family transcriptional regulator
MINNKDAGNRIASLRKSLNLTQAEFAEKLNVTTQAVSKWETGRSLPDMEILLNISWMGDISINQILDGHPGFTESGLPVDRGYRRLGSIMRCPQCKADLRLTGVSTKVCYTCEQGHEYEIDEGVVYFGSREIPGELWSLWLRNYDHYLQEARHPGLSRYQEGEVPENDVVWREINNLKPRTILDMASGTGWGVKKFIDKIDWPCTIMLTDLSHRILKWDRRFFAEEHNNPYVDMVYLACDCAKLPIRNESIDMVISHGGFESMQVKWRAGFAEAFRILKENAHTIYSMSLVDDFSSANTQKWLNLLKSEFIHADQINDSAKWMQICQEAGYKDSRLIKIYDEMPAPDSDEFPFENQIMRWMADYVVVSRK